jgi:ATP-dependent Clp protease, protease subunit
VTVEVPNLEAIAKEQALRRQQLDRFGAYFLGDITPQEAENFSKAVLVMAAERQRFPDAVITVYINSGGGAFGAGLAMMEMIYRMNRDFGVKFRTVVTGYAYSMGAIVLQAGVHRSMGASSTLMLHSTSWTLSGEDSRIFIDYERLAKGYQDMVGEIFAKRTGTHNARWWTRFVYSGRDRFLGARECLDLGLVDEIFDLDGNRITASGG